MACPTAGHATQTRPCSASASANGSARPLAHTRHRNVALNGNLFDKQYYQTLGTSTYGNVCGDPHNIMLAVRVTYR